MIARIKLIAIKSPFILCEKILLILFFMHKQNRIVKIKNGDSYGYALYRV